MRDLGQITAQQNTAGSSVDQTSSESAAIRRATAERTLKVGMMHSDLVKSHTDHSESIAKIAEAQDAFDKARVCHEESHDGAREPKIPRGRRWWRSRRPVA